MSIIHRSFAVGHFIAALGMLAYAHPALAEATPGVGGDPGYAAPIPIVAVQFDNRSETHHPGEPIRLTPALASSLELADGTLFWGSVGSRASFPLASLVRVERVGSTLLFHLESANGLLYEETSIVGRTVSRGRIEVRGDLVLIAEIGSRRAVLRGIGEIVENGPLANEADNPSFHPYASIIDSIVPFEFHYALEEGTWQPDSFESELRWTVEKSRIELDEPIFVPAVTGISIEGPSLPPIGATLQYRAFATHENGVVADVTTKALWKVRPTGGLHIRKGQLVSLPMTDGGPRRHEVFAGLVNGPNPVLDSKVIHFEDPLAAERPGGSWPTFLAGVERHGLQPVAIDTASISLRWETEIRRRSSLTAATAAEGRVFVATPGFLGGEDDLLVALDEWTGAVLWSHGFGQSARLLQPTWAYGLVYLLTGQPDVGHPRSRIRVFDSETGDPVFMIIGSGSGTGTQGPAIRGGSIYAATDRLNSLERFDAFTGVRHWATQFNARTLLTPAIDGDRFIVYSNRPEPGVYALDRLTGDSALLVPDPGFREPLANSTIILGEGDEAFHVNDDRLIGFDLEARSIRWTRIGRFHGQVAYRDGVVYAREFGRLVAIDALDGSERWRWTPPIGRFLETEIALSENLAFVADSLDTYAIDLDSGELVWSTPARGQLSLTRDTLFIARDDGVLMAFDLPEVEPR